jgi:hypothetical protein
LPHLPLATLADPFRLERILTSDIPHLDSLVKRVVVQLDGSFSVPDNKDAGPGSEKEKEQG